MIRRAIKTDAKSIAQLAVQMWPSHTVDELKVEFDSLILNRNAAVFLCFSNERTIGFAQCRLRNGLR